LGGRLSRGRRGSRSGEVPCFSSKEVRWPVLLVVQSGSGEHCASSGGIGTALPKWDFEEEQVLPDPGPQVMVALRFRVPAPAPARPVKTPPPGHRRQGKLAHRWLADAEADHGGAMLRRRALAP